MGEDADAMPAADDLDRLAIELLLDPAVRSEPFGHYRTLRTHAPVLRLSTGPVWVCTRYDDCHQTLREASTVQPPTRLPGDLDPDDPAAATTNLFARNRRGEPEDIPNRSLLRLNPPDHTRLRGLVSRGFTPRRVAELQPAVEAMTTEVLDTLADAGTGDLLDLVGFPLPVRVIGELVGVPPADRDQFRTLVRDAANSLEPGITEEEQLAAATAGEQLRDYFVDLIAARRAQPADDLTSALVGVQEAQRSAGDAPDEVLTDNEMIATLILIFAAGFETTTNLIGNGVWSLLENPAELARLRDEPSLTDAAVEEILRYQSPVQLDARRASAAFDLGGEHINTGDWIITLLGAANRDPARFGNPDTFHITERDTPVLSFATGVHYCLGAALARMEGRVLFRQLLDRFGHLELAEPARWRTTLTLRGLEALHVTAR